jgi:hypothetical protein
LAGLLAVVIAVPAQAQLIGLGVGALVPQGDLADNQNSGRAIAASIELGSRFAIRGELLWANSDLKGAIITDPDGIPVPDDANVSGDVRYISGLGSAVFHLGAGGFQPYVLGGVGMYSRSGAQEWEDAAGDVDRLSLDGSDFGWHFGAGLKLRVSAISIFGELRYHRINHEGDDVKTNFIPVLIGVRIL